MGISKLPKISGGESFPNQFYKQNTFTSATAGSFTTLINESRKGLLHKIVVYGMGYSSLNLRVTINGTIYCDLRNTSTDTFGIWNPKELFAIGTDSFARILCGTAPTQPILSTTQTFLQTPPTTNTLITGSNPQMPIHEPIPFNTLKIETGYLNNSSVNLAYALSYSHI